MTTGDPVVLLGRSLKRSEIVARAIVEDMADRAPGDLLGSESLLLAKYGVARNTLREALRILEVLGLIYVRPGAGGGPVVASLGSRDFGNVATLYFRLKRLTFGNLIQARRELETTLVRAACVGDRTATAKRLFDAIDEAAEDSSEPARWITSHGLFHDVVLEASDNPMLSFFGAALKEIHEDWGRALELPSDDKIRVVSFHRQIAESVARGDADAAGELMYAHLSDAFTRDTKHWPGLQNRIVDWRI